MSMNSFSSPKRRSRNDNLGMSHNETSELIDINLDGEPPTLEYFRRFKSPDFQPVNLEEFKKNWNDPGPGFRKSPRFDLRFRVLVCNRFKTFSSQSENISLSGILIKDLMPEEFCKDPFEIVLIEEMPESENKYWLFHAKSIDGPMRSNRLMFEALNPTSELKLLELIANLIPIG